MPMYCWQHEETKECVEIIRSVDCIDEPPTEEERPYGGKWVRIIKPNGITMHKTNAWGWGKGYWNSQTPGRGKQ